MVAAGTSGEDGAMDPLPVWKVELAQGLVDHDVHGELTLTDTHVVFMPADSEIGATIAYDAILQVKRLKLSPVLLVRWVDEGERRETAYYVAKPPPMARSRRDDEAEVALGRLIKPSRRMQQRRNSTYLAETGTVMKPVMKAWVAEVNRRRAAVS